MLLSIVMPDMVTKSPIARSAVDVKSTVTLLLAPALVVVPVIILVAKIGALMANLLVDVILAEAILPAARVADKVGNTAAWAVFLLTMGIVTTSCVCAGTDVVIAAVRPKTPPLNVQIPFEYAL